MGLLPVLAAGCIPSQSEQGRTRAWNSWADKQAVEWVKGFPARTLKLGTKAYVELRYGSRTGLRLRRQSGYVDPAFCAAYNKAIADLVDKFGMPPWAPGYRAPVGYQFVELLDLGRAKHVNSFPHRFLKKCSVNYRDSALTVKAPFHTLTLGQTIGAIRVGELSRFPGFGVVQIGDKRALLVSAQYGVIASVYRADRVPPSDKASRSGEQEAPTGRCAPSRSDSREYPGASAQEPDPALPVESWKDGRHTGRSAVPPGLRWLSAEPDPSDESLGYCRMSLRDE